MATAAAASARASILAAQDERLNWWYRDSCGGAASPLRGADFDAVIDDTLCALSGRADLWPIPPAAALAEAIRSREAMEQLYRQFATVLPLRFAGVRRASDAEHGIAAVRAWLRKGPVGANSSAQEERLGH